MNCEKLKKVKPIICIMAVMVVAFSIVGIFKANAEGDRNNYETIFTANGFYHDSKFENSQKIFMIDVSSHNTVTDWNAVYNAGIDGVMLRCGYRGWGEDGTFNTDTAFESYYTGAVNAGLKVGAYFFGQPTSFFEAISEASYVISILNGRHLDYPVAYDLEFAPGNTGRMHDANLSKSEMVLIANTFTSRMTSAGYEAMLYTNASMLLNNYNVTSISAPIWLARYNSHVDYDVNYKMWQFTSKGSINGITGNVDVNVLYTDIPVSGADAPTVQIDTTMDTITQTVPGTPDITDIIEPTESTTLVGPIDDTTTTTTTQPETNEDNPFGEFFSILKQLLADFVAMIKTVINFIKGIAVN